MMIKPKISLILTGLLLFLCPETYIKGDTPKIEVPEGIIYEEIEPSERQKISDTIYKILSPKYNGSDHLFDKTVGCGPFLWKSLLTNGVFSENVGLPIQILVPFQDKTEKFFGRVIRWQDKTLQLEAYLRNEFKNDGGFTIRRLNPKEMKLYWAMIAYDISEPIFILESKSYKILLDFHNSKAMYIDDFKDISLIK